MRKILIGLLIGFLITLPVGAMAWGEQRVIDAQEYYVDKFKDSGNTCYVAVIHNGVTPVWNSSSVGTSISCVKN